MPDKRQALRKRLTNFALNVIDLVKTLPDVPEHRALIVQLMRSGTCLGAKYTHACSSRTLTHFVSEMARVEVLAFETRCWLDLVAQRNLGEQTQIEPLQRESEALLALITRSRQAGERRERDV